MTDHKLSPISKQRGASKLARIPIKIAPTDNPLPKPHWIRVRLPQSSQIAAIQSMLKQKKLHTVCEEASCPNLPECFSHGTATFMIMGDKCTRRCSFCDVAHGRPEPLDLQEPAHLAEAVADLKLRYVVVTSVDRDDLKDGGATHFVNCIQAIRQRNLGIKIEILVPDFRGRMPLALSILKAQPADVFNHNLETIPRLYKLARPGSDYQWSLTLLAKHKEQSPLVPTKSGLMLGLGEDNEEIKQVLLDLRAHHVDMLTLGQYLQPSRFHLPVARYAHPDEFAALGAYARSLGFTHVASGPMVRSSYHADKQAAGELIC